MGGIQMVKWAKVGVSNVAGEMSLVAGLVLWVMTFSRLRRKAFELFFYTHHLYILFVIFYVLHVGISYTGTMMLPGFYLFVVDRFLRFLQSRQGVRLVSARVLPSETLELNFSKTPDLSYTPTSILFLNVPAISKLQWHPFTISSDNNLEAEIVIVIVKGEGSWTKKLYHMLSSHSPLHHLDVSIEGPYGPFSTYFLRHDALVMVSGGSGITPFISIIRHLIFLSQTPSTTTPPPPAVAILICAFRNSSDLSTLDLLLPISSPPSHHFPNLNLQIQAFVTRETKPTTENRYDHLQHKTRTLWFNPNPSALPFSPVLGSNSWLWLGVIVSSSFVMFLLLMGILTRYYIFPIDRNTNQIYSYSARSALNGLIICASIAGAATAAFYWNKKGGGWREPNQVQNLKGALLPQTAATGTAESWVVNAERELESLPQPSLADFINVHYGARPDLKRILLERRESSTGVLVCGPKEMRHEVARICSSASAQNLHFESISFSW
ncbi:ferric-chelate reductase (NADH) [Sarracenia purpurea var. burkii]